MLSHLRFHRRGQHSSPSSPGPDQLSATPFSTNQPTYPFDAFSPQAQDGRPSSSGSATLSASIPPTLPPITRVTTDESDVRLDRLRHTERSFVAISQSEARPEARPAQMARSYNSGADTGFIGGVALHKYQRDLKQQASVRHDTTDGGMSMPADGASTQPNSAPRPKPVAAYTDLPTLPAPQVLPSTRSAVSFSSPTDRQGISTGSTGRRPAGASLQHEAPTVAHTMTNAEPQRAKKSLPFLKNPMSTLLMRRRNGQNVPDLVPLRTEEPVNDPSIRGTRIHDFSAPRRNNYAVVNQGASKRQPSDARGKLHSGQGTRLSETPLVRAPASQRRQASGFTRTPSGMNSLRSDETVSSAPSQSSQGSAHYIAPPDSTPPPVPPKDGMESKMQRGPSKASRVSVISTKSPPRASSSSQNAHSINVSEKSGKDAIPRHMKSTSSRFSFDMIGNAEQEKVLEERHRQRQLEKGNTDLDDPRYDEFDDDAFDYDAMMDDDGLEERIPGVNADYEDEDDCLVEDDMYPENETESEDEDIDPGNDQENFAGFVFQRSNPSSTQATPYAATMMSTPRDEDGNPIGSAMTRDTPNFLTSPMAGGQDLSSQQSISPPLSGLGIQGFDMEASPQSARLSESIPQSSSPVQYKQSNSPRDELYFDDGTMGLGNEFAEDLAAEYEVGGEPFDESIFDDNDTDQFGRPIPGAFAQAQSSRRVESKPEVEKRESDMTSRFSAQSGLSRSTAHTSFSHGKRLSGPDEVEEPSTGSLVKAGDAPPEVEQSVQDRESMAVYQAALAAAACSAAASGKFQRSPSPVADGKTRNEDQSSVEDLSYAKDEYEALDDYGEPCDDLDDFDMDEDDIIAEANASALANDSDGWYGQEFGFYATPTQTTTAPASTSTDAPDYQYANGGFFGPKGESELDRTKSGRMISREPNLTPITERSEYSNRNSFMSMNFGFLPLSSGTPIQSPGLAQLAMMADRAGDDQMTLSSLLKLRSRAWGGSQVSLSSSKDGSPRSDRGDLVTSPWGQYVESIPIVRGHHVRKNSMISNLSRDSDPGSVRGSPTLTSGFPALNSHSSMSSSQAGDEQARYGTSSTATGLETTTFVHATHVNQEYSLDQGDAPWSAVSEQSSTDFNQGTESTRTSLSLSSRRPLPPGSKGHRHNTSADSISYRKEGEEGGETRWVMERRRTGESGQVEVLESEVVDGGRI